MPSTASPRSVIDAHADSTGPIVIRSNGTAYVAWERPTSGADADAVLFCVIPPGSRCKKPVRLPIPDGQGLEQAVTQPYPELGTAGVVYVVGPRYVLDDNVIWTSSNGGASFSAGHVVPNSYVGDLTVDDVLAVPVPGDPSNVIFDVASTGVGLGFSLTGNLVAECTALSACTVNFNVGNDILGATLGFGGTGLVEAYWDLPTKGNPTVSYVWSPYETPFGNYWHGPIKVTSGVNARLAGGPRGLFLLSQDFVGKRSQATRLDVRKWNTSTHRFGPPMTVVNDTLSSGSDIIGGFGEDAATGALYVVWEGQSSHGAFIRLWISKDGGAKWSVAHDIAGIRTDYGGPARLAVTKGKGFLTYDDGGLVLVDLSHL